MLSPTDIIIPLHCRPALSPPVLFLSQHLGCISCDYTTLSGLCSSHTVTLGDHNIKHKEKTQQNIRVKSHMPPTL